jgi:hypothetical protein
MIIIGVDYHPSFQQIAFLDQETGECGERALNHSDGEAERFYRELQQRGVSVRVGMEATGHARWFERSRGSVTGSRRPTAKMPDLCGSCCWKIAFLESGYRVRRIVICGNCFGTGIGW